MSASCIPGDPEKPWITSGIRLGTPATATRNFDEKTAIKSMDLIYTALHNRKDSSVVGRIAHQVRDLCDSYPIPERFR